MRRQYDEVHRMPDGKIEQKAWEYTFGYVKKYGVQPEYPLPLDEMLDLLDDIRVETRDLVGEYGPGTLGALILDGKEKIIALDSSIDPEQNKRKKGIYNFSLAHETGHWVLHAPAWLAAHRGGVAFWRQWGAARTLPFPPQVPQGRDRAPGRQVRQLPADARKRGSERMATAIRR